MNIPFLTRDNLPFFQTRLETIQSESQRQWGRLTPAGLMRHLRFAVESCLPDGAQPKDRSLPVVRTLLRYLFFHLWTTWPRGMVKAPASFTPAPEHDADEERRLLLNAIERFLVALDRNPNQLGLNMILGRLPLSYHTRILGIHFRHHFRQYGVL